MLKARSALGSRSSLQGTLSLNRGNTQLSTKTRINAQSKSSGRMVDGKEIWSLNEAHSKMSKYIIKRDRKCLNCGNTTDLTCSHYFGRSHKATTFDPKNLICLCIWCHSNWEQEKNGVYKDFMILLIGQEEFDFLEAKSKTTMKVEKSIIECMRFLEKEDLQLLQEIKY